MADQVRKFITIRLFRMLDGARRHIYNPSALRISRIVHALGEPANADIERIRERAARPSDISTHLEAIYWHALANRPKLTIELGTRGGDSTLALGLASAASGGAMVCVDMDDCQDAASSVGAVFVKDDDVAFASRFRHWSAERGLPSCVDVLFIDTSHTYEHTKAELDAWIPHLSPCGIVILHDTNLRRVYWRHDFTVGTAWDNERGVARALEDLLSFSFDERRSFQLETRDWQVLHDHRCLGLTVLKRKGPSASRV